MFSHSRWWICALFAACLQRPHDVSVMIARCFVKDYLSAANSSACRSLSALHTRGDRRLAAEDPPASAAVVRAARACVAWQASMSCVACACLSSSSFSARCKINLDSLPGAFLRSCSERLYAAKFALLRTVGFFLFLFAVEGLVHNPSEHKPAPISA